MHDRIEKKILPLAEFVTTSHIADNISEFLNIIKNQIISKIPKRLPFRLAPIIVTDFGWVLINSVMNSFNNSNIKRYIDWCFKILLPDADTFQHMHCMNVRLIICCAHMIHLICQVIFTKLFFLMFL